MVEHSVHTRSVICSSQIAATRPVGQAVKTPPFHGGNMGSIPVRVTKKRNHPIGWFLFLLSVCRSEPIGFDHKHLKRASAAAAFAAAVLTCASKQMRSGTPPALPAAYSRTDLLLIQSFAWHKTIHSDGFFFVIRMSERIHRVRPQAFEARERCGCICSRGFDVRVKTNAPWHEGSSAGRCLKIECRCVIML